MEIKLETRKGATLNKDWLEECPAWETLGDAVLTVKDERGEVLLSGTDGRVPPRHISVSYSLPNREYWQDCGENLQEAWEFAQRVLAGGEKAYQ